MKPCVDPYRLATSIAPTTAVPAFRPFVGWTERVIRGWTLASSILVFVQGLYWLAYWHALASAFPGLEVLRCTVTKHLQARERRRERVPIDEPVQPLDEDEDR